MLFIIIRPKQHNVVIMFLKIKINILPFFNSTKSSLLSNLPIFHIKFSYLLYFKDIFMYFFNAVILSYLKMCYLFLL